MRFGISPILILGREKVMSKIMDLTGQRFGRLVVISFVERNKWRSAIWLCVCDCGNETTVAGGVLRHGSTRSCGCLQKEMRAPIDLTGQRFGRLTAINQAEDNLSNKPYWDCVCDCGKVATVAADHLKNGHTQSCGCLQRERASEALLINLIGQRFGRLKVIGRAEDKGTRVMWNCVCDCGENATVGASSLSEGRTRSCGCLRKETIAEIGRVTATTHGLSGAPGYAIWRSMIGRCLSPDNKSYPHYGGRGITVCDRWLGNVENFILDMGPRPEGLTLERKNNDLGYTPENCIWATSHEQNQNTSRTKLNPIAVRVIRHLFDSGQKTIKELADGYRVHAATVRSVVNRKSWANV